ncbi:MAG: hypothetical protein FDX30_08655 [Chlorobium sp.]|nr:MAG: hypothetical protein FDX30_08655 [Chlorobium sp.]
MRAVLFVFGVLSFYACCAQKASATPVFARQTGFSCTACHFEQYPMLNAFGRNFKAEGYTATGNGKQSRIDDENLSLPSTLNAAFVSKLRYQKTNGNSPDVLTNDGNFSIPDEAFLAIGGRLTKNIGFELGLSVVPGDVKDGKVLADFKLPITTKVNDFVLSAIPFTTSSQGPAYGFELLNTGAVEFARALENGEETSAQQYMGTAIESTGVAFVVYNKYGFINYTPYVMTQGDFATKKPAHYIRGAVTPSIGDWDLGAGFQIWTGTSKIKNDGGLMIENRADAWALDFQAQGKVGDLPLGVYASYGNAAKSVDGNPVNVFNENTCKDLNAFVFSGMLGVIPNKLSLGAAYRIANTGASASDSDNAFTLGLAYMVAKNIQFQLNHSFYSGNTHTSEEGNNLTTLVLYSAF